MTAASHIRQTFRHAAIYSGSTILSRAVGFVLLPLYAHYLRAEGYGIIGMVEVVLSAMTLVVGYGIAQAMARFYFEKETEEERKILVSTTIIVMFLLVIGVSGPVLLFHEPLARIAFGQEGLGYYIIIAALAFICEMTAQTAESYILLRQKPFLISSLAFGRLLIGISLNIYLIVFCELGVLGYLYASLITAFIFTIVMHAYALGQVGIHFDGQVVRNILSFSLPLVPGYLASFVRGNADRVILRTYLGLTPLGAFQMLMKFSTLINFTIVAPFSKSWIVKRFEICDAPEGPETMARIFNLQLALMLFAGLILSLEIPLILRVMTPEEFWVGGAVVVLAVLSQILKATSQQLNFGLIYAKKTFKLSVIQIVAMALSVGLNILLIRRYGILGAVTAACVVEALQCLMGHFMARGYYPIPFHWRKIAWMSLASGSLFIVIEQISVERLGLGGWLNQTLLPGTANVMTAIHLDAIKGGKLFLYMTTNLPAFIEAVLKLGMSFLFLPILVWLDVLPRRSLSSLLTWAGLRHPLKARSER